MAAHSHAAFLLTPLPHAHAGGDDVDGMQDSPTAIANALAFLANKDPHLLHVAFARSQASKAVRCTLGQLLLNLWDANDVPVNEPMPCHGLPPPPTTCPAVCVAHQPARCCARSDACAAAARPAARPDAVGAAVRVGPGGFPALFPGALAICHRQCGSRAGHGVSCAPCMAHCQQQQQQQ
jgi:hypothetical protein